MNRPYKTRFPASRIKKIMQMDEEVAKAVEIFVDLLLKEMIKTISNPVNKKLNNLNLKLAIEGKEEFDFLTEISESIKIKEEKEEKPTRNRKKSTEQSKDIGE